MLAGTSDPEAQVTRLALALLLMLAAAPAPAQPLAEDPLASFADAMAPLPSTPPVESGRTYVPVYSSVMAGGGRTRIDFAVTLSIHNTSAREPLVLSRIDYFDTAGRVIQRYLAKPVAVRPYGSVQIVVAQSDIRGGLGANFVIDWEAPARIDEPAIEAVMVSSYGAQGYSFLSTGRRVGR